MPYSNLKRTPLYERHVELGATIVNFAGWEMPLHYGSIIEEHMAVRKQAGLFDVSHMGELTISGASAANELDMLSAAGISGKEVGDCTYTHLLDDRGCIIDDTIITRVSQEEFMMVPNAATTDRIYRWLLENCTSDIKNISDEVCCFALQGPLSARMIEGVKKGISSLPSFRMTPTSLPFHSAIKDLMVSRTGYTGEDGFEIFADVSDAVGVWNRIISTGGEEVHPAGLGARDSLRLEKCYLLSGTDFSGTQTTLETGYEWIVDWDHDFIGRKALEEQKRTGKYSRLICFKVRERAIPRHGDVLLHSGRTGSVTSGGYSPLLGMPIGMGYAPEPVPPGSEIEIRTRGRGVRGEVVKPPFVRKSHG